MEQEQKALQERIENGEDVVVDNPTDGEERLIEMNVGLVAGGDNADSGDWTEDSGELVDFRAFRGYAFFSISIFFFFHGCTHVYFQKKTSYKDLSSMLAR